MFFIGGSAPAGQVCTCEQFAWWFFYRSFRVIPSGGAATAGSLFFYFFKFFPCRSERSRRPPYFFSCYFERRGSTRLQFAFGFSILFVNVQIFIFFHIMLGFLCATYSKRAKHILPAGTAPPCRCRPTPAVFIQNRQAKFYHSLHFLVFHLCACIQ